MKKKGFTLIELVTVIAILSLLMLLVIPNIMHFADNSKISLKESKIKTLETAAEQFGNDYVNRFQKCTNDSTLDELKNSCSIKPIDLVTGGYLSADDEHSNILNPETNTPMTGDILLCYNPLTIGVYASYIREDDGYSCMDINVDANATLNLSKAVGVGYIGGNDLTVGILKTGSFKKNGFTCESSNKELASCSLDGTRAMKIKVTATDLDEEFEEVKIKLKAETTEGSVLEKIYTLKVYATNLFIYKGDSYDICMTPKESISFPVVSSNTGSIDVSSTDEEILLGYYDRDKSVLNVSAGGKLGSAEVKLKETNGNREVTIEKTVYSMEPEEDFPEGMLVGSMQEIVMKESGNDHLIVESDHPEVIKVFKKGGEEGSSLTLEGTNAFSMHAVGLGEANITIRGSSCGSVTFKVSVRNIYVEDHSVELFVDGKSYTTKIVAGTHNTYTCSSADPSIVACSVDGSNLTLTPGKKTSSVDGVDITVRGSGGGTDTLNVVVREASIHLVDGSNNPVSRVCSERYTGANSQEVFVKGDNLGPLSISKVNPQSLVGVRIGPSNEVIMEREGLSKARANFDTGIANIEIMEGNSNKKASFDYYVYDLESDKNLINLQTGDSTEIKIRAYTTGQLSLAIADGSIARVSATGPAEFSYEENASNDYTITVTGQKVGNTNLIIRGSDCGEMTIPIQVTGHSYSINLEKGDYVDWISDGTYEVPSLSCSTAGEAISCDVTFPKIIANDHYEKMGFSKERRHDAVGYKEGETITLSKENDGDTYYANVTEHIKPVCRMKDFAAGSTAGATSYVTLYCFEADSGLTDKRLTAEDFVIEGDNRIVSVGEGVEVRDSDNYKIGKEYEIGIYSEGFNQYNVTLKANAVVDNCGNANDETDLGEFFAADFVSEEHWYIGKDDPQDITAVLYNNKTIKNSSSTIEGVDKDKLPEDKYTLVLYGSGKMQDFTIEADTQSPWLKDGFQLLISNVVIGEGITSIGKFAFNRMENLTTVKFSEGLVTIDEDAFSFSGLTRVEFPSTLKTVEMNAFYNNTNLKEAILNDGLEVIGQTSFIGHSIERLVIPNTVTEISGRSFAQNVENMTLRSLSFQPDSVVSVINEQAFTNNRLSELTIPASVVVIGNKTFSVPSYAHSSLEKLTFEDGSKLKAIYNQAFDYNKLNSLSLPDQLVQIGTSSFRGVRDGVTSVHIGPNVTDIGLMFITGSNIREFTVDSRNTSYKARDGVLYDSSMKTLVRFPDAYYKEHSSYTVPDGVTSIQNYAFYGWFEYHNTDTKFTLNLPSTIEKLSSDSTSRANFGSFVCNKINIDSVNYLSEDGVIYNRDKTILYRVPALYNSETFTIPDTVVKIEESAFEGVTYIKNLIIPASVEDIKDDAFYTDTNYGLQNIYLQMSDVNISDSALTMFNFVNSTSVPKRNVYVSSSNLKTKIEALYGDLRGQITVSVE